MISEFQFIENIRSKYSLEKVGDDCAVLPKDVETDLLLTADLLVEDIDFRLEWTTPELLGHKALAVSLSDIAAMGGKPAWAMLSMAVPETIWNTDFLERFYAGWSVLADKYGVELVGGDVSRSPDKLVIDSITGGEVPRGRAILRSGAKPGDAIFVTGMIGGAAGGLKLLEKRISIFDKTDPGAANLISRQLQPAPQISIANLLQELDISHSLIDTSDGVSSDLGHICRESGTGAVIYADKLPIDADLIKYFPQAECLEMALSGGEDFELLFTVNEKNISMLDTIPATRIGEMTANAGTIELIREGNISVLVSKGYRHF